LRAVADASVVVKWFVPDADDEPDMAQALTVLAQVRSGEIVLCQPPHWMAEVVAVIARVRPAIVTATVDLLDAMELDTDAGVDIYKRAAALAEQHDHHLFDTLYHAVALERDAILVTADERYWRKARRTGRILLLAQWSEVGDPRGS
jgi:predicted nucleic acid-binding protein